MRNFVYPAKFEEDVEAGGYVVTFRGVRGAVTQGEDLADALEMATDCLDEAIAGCLLRGDDIPRPSRARRGERLVPVSALMASKAALYLAMRKSGMNNVQLAKHLSCDEKEVRRMLDPRHQTKIAAIQKALKVLGQALAVCVISDAANGHGSHGTV